ncbi:PQQ-dependent sugar dehydrogenase [Aldersonia sp. NBC_00410]|uniref:PQQ-dependent sugar dehydrogenase n=1 Tax=Aldersonia sp. NBC_00410 TaxID=2975954 RepID=UPI00224DED0E|nr:PQQ-dependent sugar dehydrogenase [Aldersonia sp. NBC_00410]MCX5041909.1 PQQ-dependent sugar dehydrogenase [Aldersonia sp. NBC_00410]
MAGCGSDSAPPPTAPPAADLPSVEVSTVLDGLDHPWDVVTAADGTLLTGERGGRFVALLPTGERRELRADLGDLFARGETGLMGLALVESAQGRKLFSCQGFQDGGQNDVRVVSWTIDPQWTELIRTGTVIDGFPSTSGRHGGCRILPIGNDLLIGTGDSAQPTVSQDPESLGGKVLRVDAETGLPTAGNPYGDSPVYTLGHRNVQGLAVRPGTDEVYSVEHGPTVDDEVNLLEPGANYGWKPDRDPSTYDESVPMTDPDRVPGAVGAVWSSGPSTIATASGTFLDGPQWGAWNGALAIGALKGKRVVLLRLSPNGHTVDAETTVPELDDTVGRIRTVVTQPDGSLLVTTDNGGGDDRILRVRPR